jgi:hypothetical protein
MIKEPTGPKIESKESIEQEQEKFEAACAEHFIRDYIAASPLSPEQSKFVSQYLMTHKGVWKSYDDAEVYVYEIKLEGNKLQIKFCRLVEGQPFSVEEAIDLP